MASRRHPPAPRGLRTPWRARWAVASVWSLALLGCSVEPETYSADADTGSTHALIVIERGESADTALTPRAGAVAGFVRLPPNVEAAAAMNFAGLDLRLPGVNQCSARDGGEHVHSSLGADVEFLEAGDISVNANKIQTVLAPRALPAVSDLLSGVVYTTRDQAADPLPAGVVYSVRATGGPEVPVLEVELAAPESLAGVTVGGAPLAEVSTVSAREPTDMTWAVGNPNDLIYVELGRAGVPGAIGCVFKDDVGAGTIPAQPALSGGEGRLSLRRIRSREFASAGIDHGELRFDFELIRTVRFQ
ncbi:MAG TPA: hypothetical protein VGJ84_01920 [Polyangiaceae bacterium]